MDNQTKNPEAAPRTAFLVGIQHPDDTPELAGEMLAELTELTYTLGLKIVGVDFAKLREYNASYITGSGKTRELIQEAKDAGADVIILDDFLSPAQQRNWEQLSDDLPVIDRQEVILDIFASRAHTNEAALQVELARANYSLPRLKRKWLHLSRQRGAAGGLGGRAGGEQQLELDSRVIRKRIAWLKEQLADVRRHRDIQRSHRLNKPVPVAAIVGYTNAGKSSLLNKLTKAGILAEDKLFATLDPTVRRYKLPGGQDILLADTVGFIRKLPHLLIEAFKSTLEETVMADFIIEVVDATSASRLDHHDTTQNVLAEIGASGKPEILVFNKVDELAPEERVALTAAFPNAIQISAKTGENLDALSAQLAELASAQMNIYLLRIPHDQYAALAELRKYSFILEEKYLEDGVHILAKMPPHQAPRWEKFLLDWQIENSCCQV